MARDFWRIVFVKHWKITAAIMGLIVLLEIMVLVRD